MNKLAGRVALWPKFAKLATTMIVATVTAALTTSIAWMAVAVIFGLPDASWPSFSRLPFMALEFFGMVLAFALFSIPESIVIGLVLMVSAAMTAHISLKLSLIAGLTAMIAKLVATHAMRSPFHSTPNFWDVSMALFVHLAAATSAWAVVSKFWPRSQS